METANIANIARNRLTKTTIPILSFLVMAFLLCHVMHRAPDRRSGHESRAAKALFALAVQRSPDIHVVRADFRRLFYAQLDAGLGLGYFRI